MRNDVCTGGLSLQVPLRWLWIPSEAPVMMGGGRGQSVMVK